MEVLSSPQAWLGAGLIFILRVANMSLDTLRVMTVVRGRKGAAWVLGFVQTVIFVIVLTTVMQDLTNVLNIAAYAGGFATGNVIGMWIEEKLAIGHIHLRVISSTRGAAIAERLRKEGYAATEVPGRGRDGAVTLISASVFRKQVKQAQDIIREVDPEAFMTAEDLRPLWRGFWRV